MILRFRAVSLLVAPKHASVCEDCRRVGNGYRSNAGGIWHPLHAPNQASLIYKATGNLRAIQILLGHSKIENTVRTWASTLTMRFRCRRRPKFDRCVFAGGCGCVVGEAPPIRSFRSPQLSPARGRQLSSVRLAAIGVATGLSPPVWFIQMPTLVTPRF